MSRIKKIAVLATVFSVGALAFAFTERTRVAGQTSDPQPRADVTQVDTRPLGPDGRPIGARAPKDAKATYVKTYYVGDLLPVTHPQRTPTGPATGERPVVDMTPLINLIEMAVAPGTWDVQDGYGHSLPPKANHHRIAETNPRNAMVPFFLSISLIIKCSPEAHDDVANLLRCLRRLKYGDTIATETRITGPIPQRTAQSVDAKPPANSTAERRKRIDQLLNELREEVQKLEGAKGEGPKNSLQR